MLDRLLGRTERRRLEKNQERLSRELEALRAEFGKEYKWRRRLERKVDSLLRAERIVEDDLAEPRDALTAYRFGLTSQNEEDGIVLELVRAMGPKDRRFVDIGCGRNGGNCGLLAFELGWSGLMVDASETAIRQLSEQLSGNTSVGAVTRHVTPDNINAMLAERSLTGAIDVFSLDIDSHDYWVLEALEAAQPRLLIVEYNWLFGADRAVSVPRDCDLSQAPKGYHGASLAAFAKLAATRGYRLVAVEPMGINAFFLADGEAPHLPGLDPVSAWRPQPGRKGHKPGAEDRARPDFELPLTEV